MLSILLSIAVQTPYTVIYPPDGSTVVIDQNLGDPNKGAVGQFTKSLTGPFPPTLGPPVLFQQALCEGTKGWNDANLKIVNGLPQLYRLGDPTYPLGAPWYDYSSSAINKWNPAYVRVWWRAPHGAYNNEVWPAAAFDVRGNNLDISARVIGSPSESLRVTGNGNNIKVFAVSGEQSRLMADRPPVHVKGNANRLSGVIDGQMGGVMFDGQDNWAVDLDVYAGAVADDIGLITYRKGSSGTVLRCRLRQKTRAYPSSHGVFLIYSDDSSKVNVIDTEAFGGTWGYFSHGGSDQRLENFKGTYKFAPYFLTPGVKPTGNKVDGVPIVVN